MKDYHSKHAVDYEPFRGTSYGVIEVLSFLKGRKWDEIALAYVHALRPSSIRVTTGAIKLDASKWRVTVYVDNDDTIRGIEQEVEVGIPENIPGVIDGHTLSEAVNCTDSFDPDPDL
jgi:hypothetical protein